MAGVGFELKKLFKDNNGYVDTIKAYSISAIVTEGPMILCIVMMLILQYFIMKFNGSFVNREGFLILITYTMIFSMIIANSFMMMMSRFISDCLFQKKLNDILPSFYGIVCIVGLIGLLIGSFIVFDLAISAVTKLVYIAQFCMVLITWIQITYLSCIKSYHDIVIGFIIAFVVSIASGFILISLMGDKLLAALIAWSLGYFCLLIALMYNILKYFPKSNKHIFSFIYIFDEYKILFFTGLFTVLGIYSHNFVVWFSDYHTIVLDKLRFCMLYDVPTFYASLSIVPIIIIFTVSLEVNFYERYHNYFSTIRNNGRLVDIINAKSMMKKVLTSELAYMCQLQLFFGIIASTIIGNLLSTIGFDTNMLGIYRVLCFGYCFYGITRSALIILLYFDDRKGAFCLSLIFFLLSVIFTSISIIMGIDYYGIGLLVAAITTSILSLMRIYYYINRFEYYVFCTQPLFIIEKQGFFRRLASKLGGSYEKT